MTRNSKWTKAAQAYTAWKTELQYLGLDIPDSGARLVFHMPMAKSWSKKKKVAMLGEPHQQKPDLDNLVKAVFDAARQHRGGDHTIWHVTAEKRWAEEGSIEVD